MHYMRIGNYAGMRRVSQNIIPCEKNSPHLHNALSNKNVKWYFRDTSHNGWPIVSRHAEQLCLSSGVDLTRTDCTFYMAMLFYRLQL